MGLADDVALIGREKECAQVAAVVDGARRGRGAALLIAGEPGIGKTALLGWAAGYADGFRHLHARGLESESELPYAGLSWLLQPVVDLAGALTAPQRAALLAALSLAGGAAADRFLVYTATLNLLAAASESSPLVVCVDDLPWLDSAYREALVFSARRLEAESIALLAAARTEDLRGLEDLSRLELGPLAPAAVTRLIRGLAAAAVSVELSQSTHGNPLAIGELLELLTPAQLAGAEPLPEPLPAVRAMREWRLSGAQVDRIRQLALTTPFRRLRSPVSVLLDPELLETLGLRSRARSCPACRPP